MTRLREADLIPAYPPMQTRLHKYKRDLERLPPRRITERSHAIIATIAAYRFVPTSFITRLVEGNARITERHLQTLYHTGLINRFAFPRVGNPGEFIYYLDNTHAIDLLVSAGMDAAQLDYEGIRRNREKRYYEINLGNRIDDVQGRLMHLHHEVMISRFHFMLEMACRKSGGKVALSQFRQGAQLWQTVKVPKYTINYVGEGAKRRVVCVEGEGTELLPHRPDAFFSLYYPKREEGKRYDNFFYEADRNHATTTKHNLKLRAHFHYIVKQKRQREDYKINGVRVLVESTKDNTANRLRLAARHPVVSGNTSSSLFWFTTSEVLTQPIEIIRYGKPVTVPLFLEQPEQVFRRIWLTPQDPDEPEVNHFRSLFD
jgi:hypothetical protein